MREVDRIRAVYDGYRDVADKKWSGANRGNIAMLAERNVHIVRILAGAALLPLAGRRILDVGCGGGALLRFLGTLGGQDANLFGVDLLEERVEAARSLLPGGTFAVGNAERLEFPDASFDLVTLFTVLSSILSDTMSRNLASEVRRVLRPGGHVLIYEFRVPSVTNRNTRPISRRRILQLFPGLLVAAESLTVIPPVVRRLGPLTDAVYPLCAKLPFLRTHNLALVRPDGVPTRL